MGIISYKNQGFEIIKYDVKFASTYFTHKFSPVDRRSQNLMNCSKRVQTSCGIRTAKSFHLALTDWILLMGGGHTHIKCVKRGVSHISNT